MPNKDHDRMTEHERTLAFENLCGGPQNATRLLRMYSDTYDHRSALDKLRGEGLSREDAFRRRAVLAGFSVDQIDAFLDLQ